MLRRDFMRSCVPAGMFCGMPIRDCKASEKIKSSDDDLQFLAMIRILNNQKIIMKTLESLDPSATFFCGEFFLGRHAIQLEKAGDCTDVLLKKFESVLAKKILVKRRKSC